MFMKKLLFLIPNLSYGGAEKVLVNLANHLDKSKYDVTVQTLFDVGVNRQYLNEGVHYIYNFKKQVKGNSHLLKLFSPKFLFRHLVKGEYDVLISYLEGPTARIISGCTDPRKKKLCWIHTEQHSKQLASIAFRSEKEAEECYNRFDRIICVSKTVKEDFKHIFDYKKPMEVLYNTNETQQIMERSKEPVEDVTYDKDSFTICSVARLIRSKGFDRLAKVHKRLMDDGIKNQVYVLGLGDQREIIERYIRENHLENSFRFLGFRDNPYKYVAACDLYVCPSRMEGFSTAVTEALIVGTPIVTTLCSGMEEMFCGGEYGMITANEEDALYEGVKKMLTEPGLLSEYRKKAKERGSYFSLENTVQAVEEMLERMEG